MLLLAVFYFDIIIKYISLGGVIESTVIAVELKRRFTMVRSLNAFFCLHAYAYHAAVN